MELRDYVKVIRRRWLWVVAVAAVCVAAGIGFGFLQKSTYQGMAQVLLSRPSQPVTINQPQYQQSDITDRDMQTQMEIVQTTPVAARAIRALGIRTTTTSFLLRTTVSTGGQTNVLTITVLDSTPEKAAADANALANAYIGYSRDQMRASTQAAIDEVAASLAAARKKLTSLGATSSSGPNALEVQAAQNLYNSLSTELQQLQINQNLQTGFGSMASPAMIDPIRVSPNFTKNGLLGLSLGLLLGLIAAFVAESLDDRIASSEQAEEAFGVTPLAVIPPEKNGKTRGRMLAVIDSPASPAAEAYRALRNDIDFFKSQSEMKTLLVSSAEPGEGKSSVAANLAAVLALAGWRVGLVDSDFRRPVMDTLFRVKRSPGLWDILAGVSDLDAALQGVESLPNLRLLAAGRTPPDSSELLGSARMDKVVADLSEQCDWVIIDTAPLLTVADATATVRWADAVLLVARGGATRRNAARKAREQLDRVDARVLGVVLVGADDDAGRHGYGSSGNSDDGADH